MIAMVLEPSRFFQNVLETILRDSGFTVHCFSEPPELKKALQVPGASCDLLCLSLRIRGGTSIDLTRELRAIPALKLSPMVLITSTNSEEEVQQALKAGITEVFYKSDLQAFQDYTHNLFYKSNANSPGQSKILYAEDSMSTAHLIKSWLEKIQAKVTHVKTAEEALLAFSQTPDEWDLILTDFLLAGKMSGLGLIREIRGTLEHRVPILVSSGLEDATRKVEILRSGANDYVAKPVMEEELQARVQMLIANKRLMDEVEAQRKRLSHMALHDPLTGLCNRYSVMEQAPVLLEQAVANQADFSVAILDLDHFKKVNDTMGHQKGDNLLIYVAQILQKSTPSDCFCARLGGEEFLLILPGYSMGKAFNLCEDMRVHVASGKPEDWQLTVSIGLASLGSRKEANLDRIISEADTALYEAKAKGRNRVEKSPV